MKTLADAFEHTLKDVYFAETAITKALPKMADAATNADLKAAFKDHLADTKKQITILKDVFKTIGVDPKGEKCDAIEGLLKEGEGIIKEAEGVALNVSLIGVAQAVEHYEIARYGTLREWAKTLGNDEAHSLLTEILDMEKACNFKLTNLAVDEVNAAGKAKKKKAA